jgi:hypothetical protein
LKLGLILVKNISVRIIFTCLILMGIVFRRSISGQIKSLLIYQPFATVETFKELSERDDIKPLFGMYSSAAYLLNTSDNPMLRKIFNKAIMNKNDDLISKKNMDKIISGKAVYVANYFRLSFIGSIYNKQMKIGEEKIFAIPQIALPTRKGSKWRNKIIPM